MSLLNFFKLIPPRQIFIPYDLAMKISVQVKPGARENRVEPIETGLQVHLRARPDNGKANAALVCVLAEHFSVRKSQVTIKSGHRSRSKIVEIGKSED